MPDDPACRYALEADPRFLDVARAWPELSPEQRSRILDIVMVRTP
jgi:hypothetical protein